MLPRFFLRPWPQWLMVSLIPRDESSRALDPVPTRLCPPPALTRDLFFSRMGCMLSSKSERKVADRRAGVSQVCSVPGAVLGFPHSLSLILLGRECCSHAPFPGQGPQEILNPGSLAPEPVPLTTWLGAWDSGGAAGLPGVTGRLPRDGACKLGP